MMKENIILIGMPGVGKSTLGVVLAKRLGYDFLDVDIQIAKKAAMPLQKILDTQGLDAFLQLEAEMGQKVDTEKTVIATGGSMVLSETAMKHLKTQGICVFLNITLAELEARNLNMKTRGIAAKPGTTLEDVYTERQALYKRYADVMINCDNKGAECLVQEIAEAIL